MSLLSKLWKLDGTVDRPTYLAAGVVGAVVKFLLDWSIARYMFETEWTPFNYWRLIRTDSESPLGPISMLLLLFALSLPFLWFAMAMTLLRLRDSGRSAGWAALLFVPVVNGLLFIALSLLPPRDRDSARDLSGALESALFAVVASVAIAIVAIGLSTHLLATYGLGLFVAVPFCLGYLSAFFHRRRHPAATKQPYLVALFALALLGGLLLALSWEGAICLVMAAPLALAAALIGAYFGSLSGSSTERMRANHASVLIVALVPFLTIGESAVRTTAPTFRVDSTIVIEAPIERVWENVVSFSDITAPPEWYFRSGIAYPLRARIVGEGVGAVRYCEFTTGAFVEPIRIWDEPHLLTFDVSSNPPPMRELSLFGEVDAPHLTGFMVSRRGQFALRTLAGGRTEVRGTTWYQHHLWPANYWTWWSDAIIHRIHLRVLNHIRNLSETAVARASSSNTPGQ